MIQSNLKIIRGLENTTKHISNFEHMKDNEYYVEILKRGEDILPDLFEQLLIPDSGWVIFLAIDEILDYEIPKYAAAQGRYLLVKSLYMSYGIEHGYYE